MFFSINLKNLGNQLCSWDFLILELNLGFGLVQGVPKKVDNK